MDTESLHHTLDALVEDAKSLARGERDNVGVIELNPDWENNIGKILHRYQKEIRRVAVSFSDPHGEDEAEWIKAHYRTTMEFLITHGLATKTNEHI